jgi:hypothetical protein
MSTPVVGQLYFLEKRRELGLLRVGKWLSRRGPGHGVVSAHGARRRFRGAGERPSICLTLFLVLRMGNYLAPA